MAKVSPIYTNFNGGEYGFLLYGRSDLDQYSKGGLDYKNMILTQYGPTLNAPGTRYSNDTKTMSEASRLIPHKPNVTDASVIELGAGYFRFATVSGQIESGGSPYNVSNSYAESELFNIQYAPSNDVITLTHEDHEPAKLTRIAADNWTFADYEFVGNPYLPDNTNDSYKMTASVTAKGATGTLTASGTGNTPFLSGHVGSYWKVGEPTGTPEIQGYVKITGFTSTTVVDIEVIEALSTGVATSDWAEAAWSDVRGWPARCTYFGGRLWMGKTSYQPNGVWGSKPFIYDNFDPGTGLDDDAISELVPDCSEIMWLEGDNTLIIGSDVGDFALTSGDSSGTISPENVTIRQQTGWSSEPIQPARIGSNIYSVQSRSRKLREIGYSIQADSYASIDTNAFAEHITKGGIVDMDYQRNPYSLLYCVLDSGKMAVMCREVDQAVLGWTPLDTEDGDAEYESVATIPHPTEDHDTVWVIVKRTINGSTERHMEYFESPKINDRQELCFYVHDGLTYNAYESNTGGTLTLSAITGDGITVTAGSSVFVPGSVGQRIRAINTTTGVVLGELEITQYNSGTEVLGDVVYDFSTTSYVANAWGISVNTVSGLDHLEAKNVAFLVDGGTDDTTLTVASGSITIPDGDDGFIINVGLGYTSRWKNMPIEAGSQLGTAQGKKKRIYQCGYKFYRSLGMKVGGDENNLKDLILRNPETLMGDVEAYFTGIVEPRKLDSTADYEGHIVIEQSRPLPMCILSVMPLLETYDK